MMRRLHHLGQLALAWAPVWVLYLILVQATTQEPWISAALVSMRGIVLAALLGMGVARATELISWPAGVSMRFVASHLLLALVFASAWIVLVELIEAGIRLENPLPAITHPVQLGPRIAIGGWLYGTIAAVAYARRSVERLQAERERALRAEAEATRAQLQAIESHLRPHFLFNALNTVAGLIPRDQKAAETAVENLGELLRTTLRCGTSVTSLRDEWEFVSRYLDMERLRYGNRIGVEEDIPESMRDLPVPSFALHILVENATRHAVAATNARVRLRVTAAVSGDHLHLTVTDDGPGTTPQSMHASPGFGLRSLRERLHTLYGDAARLVIETSPGHGLSATIRVPTVPKPSRKVLATVA